MFRPVPPAQPTPVVLAHFAGDVIAPLVLLDRHLAARTGLGVGHDPIGVLCARKQTDRITSSQHTHTHTHTNTHADKDEVRE